MSMPYFDLSAAQKKIDDGPVLAKASYILKGYVLEAEAVETIWSKPSQRDIVYRILIDGKPVHTSFGGKEFPSRVFYHVPSSFVSARPSYIQHNRRPHWLPADWTIKEADRVLHYAITEAGKGVS